MMAQNRMSPLTALFLGIFGVGAVAIGSSATVVLYALRIVDTKADAILAFTGQTVEGIPEFAQRLPELIESLPQLADTLVGSRTPGYVPNIEVVVKFVQDKRSGGFRPVLTITNHGEEMVSMLTVRIAALTADGAPVREWTEVVATPIALDRDMRGPLFAGETRYVVVSTRRTVLAEDRPGITGDVEISELRLWQPTGERVATASRE